MKQQAFSLVEVMVAIALMLMLSLFVTQFLSFEKSQYNHHQDLAQLNQKQVLIRDILQKFITFAKQEKSFYIDSATREDFYDKYKVQGDVLVIEYNLAKKCQDSDLPKAVPPVIHYFFVAKGNDGIMGLRCKTIAYDKNGNKISVNTQSLVANVDFMSIRFFQQQGEKTYELTSKQLTNSQNIKRLDFYLVIASDEKNYQNYADTNFDANLDKSNIFKQKVEFKKNADGFRRKGVYFAIAPMSIIHSK